MKNKIISLFLFLIIFSFLNGCTGMAASAEEYYTIGMAYFDNGKYEEAEMWLNRARQADRTMTASVYNLGRIAFERQRYREAASHFENILEKDPDNVLALKAAAFTRIRTGDLEIASRHYSRLLTLVPESADDGYNHALVLYAMERYGEAEDVLNKYPFALLENNDVMLLHARTLKAQNKIEAIDSYSNILSISSDPKVRYEYAQLLEYHKIYARSLEEYRQALSQTQASSSDPARRDIHFSIARVLLTADGENSEGITELESAVNDGFKDISLIEELLNIDGVSIENKNAIRGILGNLEHES
ncbi:MAG: tetratricopeptide repeat protein [Treponema sp.]|jgi:tetratricopeptide (TPR) repeat protein|nr:tetratricopeptide repeat protein [Treponema sp.]